MLTHRVGLLAWAATLCALLLWPLIRPGYLLGHDMVFTPRQPLTISTLGLSASSPRAVPLDAWVALAERIVDGAVVARIALILPILAAGLGVAVLLRSSRLAAGFAACGFAIWNPYVVERLALGQWALLWCYASLPWVVVVIVRVRGARSWLLLALVLAAASITPTGGLIATAVAIGVAVGVRRTRRHLAATAAISAVMQLPWIVPSVVTTAASTSDPDAVAAFAARGEFSGGPFLSLLGGGGIWNSDVVPASRSGALPWLALAVLTLAAAVGARRLATLLGSRLMATLTVLAGIGLIVAIVPSVPGLDAVARATVTHVPGAGLLRDAHKWIMPLVLLEALFVGAATDAIAERIRTGNWRVVLLVGAAVLPILLLPDGSVRVRSTVEPIAYPDDWSVVAARARDGTAVVLPFSSYRTFPWAPGRTSILDPAPRLLQVPVVVQDRLSVGGRLLGGEDSRAAEVTRALGAGDGLPERLAHLGIRWVVVERDTLGTVPSLAGLRQDYAGDHVALYRVPGSAAEPDVADWRAVLVVTVDLFAVVFLLAIAVGVGAVSLRRRRAALL